MRLLPKGSTSPDTYRALYYLFSYQKKMCSTRKKHTPLISNPIKFNILTFNSYYYLPSLCTFAILRKPTLLLLPFAGAKHLAPLRDPLLISYFSPLRPLCPLWFTKNLLNANISNQITNSNPPPVANQLFASSRPCVKLLILFIIILPLKSALINQPAVRGSEPLSVNLWIKKLPPPPGNVKHHQPPLPYPQSSEKIQPVLGRLSCL